MKTIAKLYKEYGGFCGMIAIFGLLALLITSTCLIINISSVKAEIKITSDCVYYDEEKLDSGTKVCYYECDNGPKEITIKDFSECPTNE